MLEAVEGELCLLELPEARRCVRLCMLEAMEDELCLLEVTKVMRCVALYAGGCGGRALFAGGAESAGGDALRVTLYAVEGKLYLLKDLRCRR